MKSHYTTSRFQFEQLGNPRLLCSSWGTLFPSGVQSCPVGVIDCNDDASSASGPGTGLTGPAVTRTRWTTIVALALMGTFVATLPLWPGRPDRAALAAQLRECARQGD